VTTPVPHPDQPGPRPGGQVEPGGVDEAVDFSGCRPCTCGAAVLMPDVHCTTDRSGRGFHRSDMGCSTERASSSPREKLYDGSDRCPTCPPRSHASCVVGGCENPATFRIGGRYIWVSDEPAQAERTVAPPAGGGGTANEAYLKLVDAIRLADRRGNLSGDDVDLIADAAMSAAEADRKVSCPDCAQWSWHGPDAERKVIEHWFRAHQPVDPDLAGLRADLNNALGESHARRDDIEIVQAVRADREIAQLAVQRGYLSFDESQPPPDLPVAGGPGERPRIWWSPSKRTFYHLPVMNEDEAFLLRSACEPGHEMFTGMKPVPADAVELKESDHG